MKYKIVKLLLTFALFNLIDCKGYFTLFAPKYVTQDNDYQISITSQGYAKPQEFEISVIDSNLTTLLNKSIIIDNDSTKEISLDVRSLESFVLSLTTYYLQVKTIENGKDVVLKERLTLHNTRRSGTITAFVQTDKSIYKPSDKIQFRVLILNADTKPLIFKRKVQVQITDGADNRVKQFDDVTLIKGVYQNELQLSDMPVLGNWNIRVIDGRHELKVKNFEVAEYTLPKFEVTIESNPHVSFKDGKIRATVKAKFTFGKFAKGNATIIATVDRKKASKTVEVDGKKSVEFNMKNDLGISDKKKEKSVTVDVTFKEELSGREQNETTIVKIHPTPHYIELKTSHDQFKNGLPFSVTAFVKYHDKDAPVEDNYNAVVFTIKHFYEGIETCSPIGFRSRDRPFIPRLRRSQPHSSYQCRKEKSYNVEKEVMISNGIATLEIPSFPANTTKITVKAEYLETSKMTSEIKKTPSESKIFLQIKPLSQKLKVSEKVKIDVISTNNLRKLTYHVLNYEKIFISKTVEVPNEKEISIELTPTIEMAPNSYFYVFYITSDGEFIHDYLILDIETEAENHLNIELSKHQTKPGGQIDIFVSSNPNSFIGLLGVDKSVLLLKKGNDIEKSEVAEILKQKEKKIEKEKSKFVQDGWWKSLAWNEMLTGLLIITNVEDPHYSVELPPERRRYPIHRTSYNGLRFGGNAQSAWSSPSYSFSSVPSFARTGGIPGPVNIPKNRPDSVITQPIPQREIKIRNTFPETWIFDSIDFDTNTQNVTISKKVPDTITSWIITGFSVDPMKGLALTEQPTMLNVFQSFFVTTNLPYSIKRGEVVSIPIVVFNYLESDQQAEVTLFNEEREFEFTEVKNDENQLERRRRSIESQRKKNVVIKSQSGSSISFMIRPLKVGHIKIKVTANSAIAGDGIERQLIVEPEGVTHYKNKALLIDLRNNSEFKTNEVIAIPSTAVPDSTRIEFSVIGDILGPSIENLDKLIKLPYGCGEQNMLNFVPNIIVLDYLTSINKVTSEIEAKTKKYMETGYQRELRYKHNDGSYSAFGKSDRKGSTWLTAFVAKSFYQASKYITIDDDIIKQALDFLANIQATNGNFPEVGHVSHKDMQGGSSKGIALTAYTLITFLENEKLSKTYQSTIDKALSYIIDNIESLNDDYSLAISSYALLLAKHDVGYSLLSKLQENAVKSKGLTHWEKSVKPRDDSWDSRPNSIDIEMSAYGLQALLEGRKEYEAFAVMKWLIKQRNENGGFQSTQDTVVGIQALSKLSAKFYSSDIEIENMVKYQNGEASLSVNGDNAFILQKHELPSDARNFEITAKGRGVNLLQLSYKYNMNVAGTVPSFLLEAEVEKISNKEFLQLKVCTSYVPNGASKNSNMAIMEVTLPSGFTYDTDSSPELLSTENVKKIETKDGETIVVVYFNDLSETQICPQFKAYRTHSVAKQKAAPIIVYDYYENSRRATTFYNPPEISLCDICNGAEECKEDCEQMEINVVAT